MALNDAVTMMVVTFLMGEQAMMKNKTIDILAVITLTLVVVALTLFVPGNIVAVRIFALPLVLVLPGYALLSALFFRQTFSITERLLYSPGISLAIVISGGLVLNVTPTGFSADSWALLLGCVTLAACIVALVRRRGQSASPSRYFTFSHSGFTFRQGVLLGLASVIVCGAIAVSIIGAEQQPYPGFTQLWILPVQGASAKNSVLLGVKNMEHAEMTYLLEVNVDGKLVKTWPSIALKQSESWEMTLLISQTKHAGSTMVEAMLYRVDAPTKIYRHVELWLST